MGIQPLKGLVGLMNKKQLKYAQSLIGKLVDTPTHHNDTPCRVELTSDECGPIVMVHFSGGESFPLGDVQLAKKQYYLCNY